MHHSVSATSLSVLVVLLALSFLAGQGHAQVLFEDDFEACSCALRLACQDSTHWDTWSSSPCDTIEDPCVTNIVAFSGVNSVWIRQGNDLIHPIPAYTDGKYRISFRLLIPSGFTASWGQLAEFVSPTTTSNFWGFYARFNPSGNGTINADRWDAAGFSFAYDTWMQNALIVDLENDRAEFYFEGELIYSWRWTASSDSTCPLQLSVTDIMGSVYPNTGNSEWYLDDYLLEQLDPSVSVGPKKNAPLEFALRQNFPNPFNPTTTMEYALPHAGHVTLRIYTVLGEEIAELANAPQPAGTFTARWDATGVPSGIYFYRLTAGGFVQTRKMVLMR